MVSMDAYVRIEDQSIGTLKALLDLAKQALSQMDNITGDDLDIVQINGREFLREAVELVDGLLFAISCRNQSIFAETVRMIAERWTVWEKIVVDSDDPFGEVEKAALASAKRLRNIAVKRPKYQQAVRDLDDDVLASTGRKLAEVGIPRPLPVGSPTDETDTMDYAIMSAVSHANFTWRNNALRFDDIPQIWAIGTFNSARFFGALHDHIVFTVLGEQTTPRTGQWVNPNRWADPHSHDG